MHRNEWVLTAVVGVVLAGFTAGTIYAGYITHWIHEAPRPERMQSPVNDFLLSINLVLVANLGAYLGISAAVEGWDRVRPIGVLQWAAAWTYIVTFVMAAAFWALADFTEDKTKVAAVLPAITRSGVSVIVAVFGAALGVRVPAILRRLREQA
jgi:hypothetical protein